MSVSLPTIMPCPGGWAFDWKEENLSIRLERLREHHDSITAELWAEDRATQDPHLLGGLRFALTTPGGRLTMAKLLLSRRNGVDWGGMMEQVCVYALRNFRLQEPLLHIGNLPQEPSLRFRLRPLLPEGMTTLLYGYGGVAKSTLSYAWGSLVQLGVSRLGLEPTPGPVLFLDWETNADIANRTLKALHAGLELPGLPDFHYRRCRRPLTDFMEDLQADVGKEGIGLIIVDSLAKACGGEKEIKENALPTMNALESLGVSNLVINHRPKGEEGKDRGSYGSVFVENNARQGFRVEARHSPEENVAQVALFHTKHNLMNPLKPIGYRIIWDNLWGTKIELEDVSQMEELRERLKASQRIQDALHQTPRMTVAEIVAETELPEDTVRKTLSRAKGKTFVELSKDPSVWGIKSRETPEAFR